MIVKELTARKLAKSDELLKAFETPLRSAALKASDENDWLDVLAFLYVSDKQHEKLHEVDGIGWHQRHLANYANSYVAGIEPDSPDFASMLAAALGEFPNSVVLTKYALARDWKTSRKLPAMTQFVAAEFSNVASNSSGYRLND